jgi:hypothetical protein
MFFYLYCAVGSALRQSLYFCAHVAKAALMRIVLGPAEGRRPILRLSLFALISLGFGYGFIKTGLMQAAARTAIPALESGWDDVKRPLQLYGLGGTEFGKLSLYEARRHRSGGGRQDFLSFGQFDNDHQRYLTASFYRPGREQKSQYSFFDAIVRRAAQSGLAVGRLDVPDRMASRFGVLEVADTSLYVRGHVRNCLAYRLDAEGVDFRMAGFACGAGQVIDRLALACAIDRLDLLAAGDDDELVQFFTRSENRRSGICVTKMGPGQKSPPWLDASAPIPPLRSARGQIKVAQ